MERSEPTLVPEWLRGSGSISGGGSSNHHFVSSSSHSDSTSIPHNTRNKSSRSKSDIDNIHSPFLDRSSSTNSRRGSSNGSAKHAYSSFNFNRSHRDKDRGREKDRLSFMDPWDSDPSVPLGGVLTGREKDQLRRSHSMISRKLGDHLSRGSTAGLKNGGNSNHYNGNGILPGPNMGNSFQKTGFDKDFPSLGTEDRHGGPDVVRVSSPGLSSAVQSLPLGNSALIGGEGWTSALAEVPNVIEKTGTGLLSSPQASFPSAGTSTGTTSLNMAEALVQAPARTRTPPQGSAKTQRLEELAIKQSRQLIPVVPAAPKGSILNPSDKSKTKQVVRTSEIGLTPSRSAQQQPSALLNPSQSIPGGQMKPDASKKLLVLKPARENGISTAPKESPSPSSNTNGRVSGNQLNIAPAAPSAPVRSSNSPKERRGTPLSVISGLTMEKRPSSAQTQSRNDFFNLLKQKTSTNTSTDPANHSSHVSPSVEEKADNGPKELLASDPSSPQASTENDNTVERIQRLSHVGERSLGFEAAVAPDEKEAEFLRSLGWDENECEDEALTQEEISAFIEQYKKLRPPSMKLLEKLSVIEAAYNQGVPDS